MSRNGDLTTRGYPSGLEGRGCLCRDFWNTDNLGKKGKTSPQKHCFLRKVRYMVVLIHWNFKIVVLLFCAIFSVVLLTTLASKHFFFFSK